MRTCPSCRRAYEQGIESCPDDGVALVDAPPGAGAEDWLAYSNTSPTPRAGRGTPTPPDSSSPRSTPVRVRAGAGTGPDGAASPARPNIEREDPLLGTTISGRYKVTRKIGEGGMGAVYEAQHTLIGKRVAVKVLLERYAQKTDVVARLKQEARLASSIGHEHIVDITDFGETEDGRTFVVMEYLEGESLADLIAREAPLPAARAIAILRQVADALGAAHAKGIIHRDVKPENIFLIRRADQDFVKVVDFGISKLLRPGDQELERLTQTGMVLGTPLYMSPEQARGEEDLDHRIDVYAVGVILYEMVTGEVPFRGKNSLGILNQVLAADARRPRELRPDLGISEALDAVILCAMAKDRRERYQSMGELDADLARLQAGELDVGPMLRGMGAGRSTTGAFARRSGRRLLRAAAVAAVAFAIVLGVRLSMTDRRPLVPTDRPALPAATPPRAPAAVARPSEGTAASRAPEPVDLVVMSEPEGAEILYKGPGDADYRRVGTTPYSGRVPRAREPGFLKLVKSGYEPLADLQVDPARSIQLDKKLRPEARATVVPSAPPPASPPPRAPAAPAGTTDVASQLRMPP